MVLTGLRGVGKTVLLNELADRARRRDWIVAQVEARLESDRRGSDFRSLVARSLNQSLRSVTGRWGLGDKLRAALATFRSFSIRTDPSGGLSLGIDVDPTSGRADTGSLDLDLSELALDLAESATELGVGVAVFVDEMQDLDTPELAAICTAVHESGQRSAPFYVVGGGLPNLPAVLSEAKSYAERLFAYRPIGQLGHDAAALALLRPAEQQGVRWAGRAVDQMIDASSGYPYFLQEFAKATWDYAPGPGIGLDDVSVGIRVGREKLDAGFYRSRWNRATPAEREYMVAMAPDGDAPSSSGEVARRLGRTSMQQVGPARAKLINKGLLYAPQRGLIAFTVPGMAGFVTRQVE